MNFEIGFCIILLIGCVMARPEEPDSHKTVFEQKTKLCATEYKIDTDIVAKLRDDNVTLEHDEHTKCFINCFLRKIGFYLDNGEINEKVAKTLIALEKDPVKGEQAFNKCKTKKGPNDCETAWELYKCFKTFKM